MTNSFNEFVNLDIMNTLDASDSFVYQSDIEHIMYKDTASHRIKNAIDYTMQHSRVGQLEAIALLHEALIKYYNNLDHSE